MATLGGPSIAPIRPAHMENECLVVAGFNKDLTQVQFKNLVNVKAERNIDFLFLQSLSKGYSKWRTIAIELSSEDYALLHDPSFWDPQFRIRPYIGHKFWRGNRPARLKTHEIRTALRDQWVAPNSA